MAAPVSYGYPNAGITADKLPIWQQPLARFTVGGPDHWKVSSLGSLDRGIRIEAGTGSGDAVTDITTPYETMSLPKPDVAARWYLIVRRRNWSGTGTTTLAAIAGTAAANPVLPSRLDEPGARSDQPLAMVRVTQADSTVQQIIDLRCWASNGGVEVGHDLALSYLGTPGAVVRTPTGVRRYQRGANNVWGWVGADDYRPTLAIEDTDATAPKIKAGTATVRTDANGAAAVVFKERYPRALSSAYIQQAYTPTLGMVDCRWDEGLSGPHRLAFFAFNAAGDRLRNVPGLRVSYIAVGD